MHDSRTLITMKNLKFLVRLTELYFSFDQSGIHPPVQDVSERARCRPRGRKSKKGRKLKPRHSETPTTWPPRALYSPEHGEGLPECGSNMIQNMEATGIQGNNPVRDQTEQGASSLLRDRREQEVHRYDCTVATTAVDCVHPPGNVTPAVDEENTEPIGHESAPNHIGTVPQSRYHRSSEAVSPHFQCQSPVMAYHAMGNQRNVQKSTDAPYADLQLTSSANTNRTQHDLERLPQSYDKFAMEDPAVQIMAPQGTHYVHEVQSLAYNEDFSPNNHTEHVQPQSIEDSQTIHEIPAQLERIMPSENQANFHGDILHRKSTHGVPNRVRKPKSRKRVTGPSDEMNLQLNQLVHTDSDSPQNQAILNALAICLRASDSKARDTVEANTKAYEITIASLQETISQQKLVVGTLQSENGNLRLRVDTISESAIRFQQQLKDMEGDYARLRTQSSSHYEKFKKEMMDQIKVLECEKTAIQQDFSRTVDVLGKSQRSMRNVMNDCFNKVQLTESRLETALKEFHTVSVLYKEAKERVIGLEKQILPCGESIKETLVSYHTDIVDNLQVIRSTQSSKAVVEEQDSHIRQCLEVLRSLQSTPVLTTKHTIKIEAMLRHLHDR